MSNSNAFLPNTAPFTPDQVQWLNGFLPNLQPDQLIWMEGYISGLRAGQGGATVAAPAAPAAAPTLTVLFGSESGNAESLADQTVKAATKLGFKAKAVSMGDIKPAKLKGTDNLLVLVSTWGEGDAPENAVDFVEAFLGDKAPKLEGTRFSVLGLGDTSYEHFCKMGIDIDARLEALGAQRVYDRKDCDVDFDDDYAAWSTGALGALKALAAPAAATSAAAAAPATTATVKYSRKNPFPSELTERVMLNGEGSAKETVHLEFNLEGSGLTYEAGDALAVIPHNAQEVVDAILEATKLDGSSTVTLKDGECTLSDALTRKLDATAISLPVLKRYNEFAQDAKLAALIEDKEALKDYSWGREIIDVLVDFPAKSITADQLAGTMRKLPPRLYSIASSPKAHPGEVHLTVGVVRYETNDRSRNGVCSSFLADRIEEGSTVDIFVTPNKHFKVPANPDAPLIMVGPGTGIAPFRAFIEERKETDAKGKNWLIFGDQHYLTDFLYQTEWQDYLADGVLTKLDVAFSRDQKEKVYVQDRMRENAKELYAWLEEGASFCVCGDATRMAHDVDQALHDVIAQEGGLSEEAAADYVKQLKADKRYLRDVY
ncbi:MULTISPECIES: assimilatory sulfite reductase (NADPH) flavoprotein subunit [unclassified Lentimonas]|uniref:assimilatory sulfite reductase (NADPH) flavoprotein subunit n=1 Tax=unclassified Lentimonas TaxID=2630993 RepID=UPI0013250805|nr:MULTISPECIES: assimilatory sulfite reductase (NADPH) flavoprotein subunit [unclassified Lentimonas]CAA6679223.1 Sulfite reductase [NADPH] flavoprotein alpha-component (EC [Lentimonas sp. CC4]CAA6685887.1 Sulfite reductase [NADPH] flavoprotein alpha-component (EC [Lentimonas sp. CC6]CAA7076022.1 Sulfite reductase [NADPH] flavoprotein alpha-component (EC [Lentimonas sp. CC4]CAA7168545.1 Sulfite reductase [NADPH] flavoprotein alpha-component (EC [Lentimonas sp. CC21]CAA7180939.1 Sulfite reduct